MELTSQVRSSKKKKRRLLNSTKMSMNTIFLHTAQMYLIGGYQVRTHMIRNRMIRYLELVYITQSDKDALQPYLAILKNSSKPIRNEKAQELWSFMSTHEPDFLNYEMHECLLNEEFYAPLPSPNGITFKGANLTSCECDSSISQLSSLSLV